MDNLLVKTSYPSSCKYSHTDVMQLHDASEDPAENRQMLVMLILNQNFAKPSLILFQRLLSGGSSIICPLIDGTSLEGPVLNPGAVQFP